MDEGEKEGEGILFTVYSRHYETLHKYYEEAVVKIAIATNIDIPEEDNDLWFKVVNIPTYHIFWGRKMRYTRQKEKQFMTKVLYFASTPFKTTLQVDTTAYFCDEQAPSEMLNLMKNSNVDFAISHRSIGAFFPSSWATLYNWNSRTKLLLRDWVHEMLNTGIAFEDDQLQIYKALQKAVKLNRIKARRLSSNWAFAPRCYCGDGTRKSNPCNFHISVPVNGKVRLTHATYSLYCEANGKNNEYENITRVYVIKSSNGAKGYPKSQKELNEFLNPYSIPNFDWSMKKKSPTSIFWEKCSDYEPFCGFS